MGVSNNSSSMNSKLLLALAVLGCLSLASAGNRYNNYNNNHNSRVANGRYNNRYNNNGRNNRYDDRRNSNRKRCDTKRRYNKRDFIRQYGSGIYHKCWYGGSYNVGNTKIICSSKNGHGYLINVQICRR